MKKEQLISGWEKYSDFLARKLQQHGLGCFEELLCQMANVGGRKKGNDLSSAADVAFKSEGYT